MLNTLKLIEPSFLFVDFCYKCLFYFIVHNFFSVIIFQSRDARIQERNDDLMNKLRPVEDVISADILQVPEKTTIENRVTDIKTKLNNQLKYVILI